MAWDYIPSYEASMSATANADGTGSNKTTEKGTLTSTVPTNVVQAKLFAPIPTRGNTHPDESSLRVENVSLNQVGPFFFEVSITYVAASELGENPLDEPPKITIDTVTSTEQIDEDIHGDPIQTVNGEPLVGVTEVIPDMTITVQRNLPSFDPASIYTYVNHVNEDSFLGFAPGTVKVMKIRSRNVVTDDLTYWDTSITFQARQPIRTTAEKAWWKRVKHQGLKIRRAAADTAPFPVARDKDGEPETSPVMIKDDGTRETDTEIGHWKEFETVDKVAFAGLNLLA